MARRRAFDMCHPSVNLLYFLLVLVCSVGCMHPACLGISLGGALACGLLFRGRRAVGRLLGLLGQPRRRLDKVGWGAALLSSLLGWSLENAIETADTMRSRGYGLPGRTCFSIYRLDRRDKGLLGWLALSGGYVVAGWAAGGLSYTYYPACQAAGGPGSLSLLTVYLALCLTPLALEAWEERQWKRTTKNTGR